MSRMILLPLLLLVEPAAAQSLRERIEAEATEIVVDFLSATVETTLISEGRAADYASCVGQSVADAFREATQAQRQNGMREWIDDGKQQCNPLLASADRTQPQPK